MPAPRFLTLEDGGKLAYHKVSPDCPDATPGVIFLGGFKSDMGGAKALFLDDYCRAHNLPFVRFDYCGHGQSSGKFTEGTIGGWAQDALAILDHAADAGRQHILVGSSMGGWVMLLAALARPERVAGLLGIASAPDFTETLIWDALPPEDRLKLQQEGVFHLPSEYCNDPAPDPYPITLQLIKEARRHLLLRGENPIPIMCPVRLLHGMADKDVPCETSLTLARKLAGAEVTVTLLKGAGHRMSEPAQLAALVREMEAFAL